LEFSTLPDNAIAECFNGLYKWEPIYLKGPLPRLGGTIWPEGFDPVAAGVTFED
jgi:hypothetical protein